jgi:penicillin-binding protein 1A
LGIDPRAIGAPSSPTSARAGSDKGGSTLTQQLAKDELPVLGPSLKRKAQEVIIAFWLEGWLTKDEILSRYLSSSISVTASMACARRRAIFRPQPGESQPGAIGMLAGLVQAPSRLAPTRNLPAPASVRAGAGGDGDTGAISPARARAARGRARPADPPHAEGPDRHLFRRLDGAPGRRCL